MIFKDILNTIIKKNQHDEFIYPAYEDYCFSNIPSAIKHILGLRNNNPLSETLDTAGITPSKPVNVILFLLDGFGYNQWIQYMERYVFLKTISEKGIVIPLTSVFPSTTASSLTTIHSGLTPQEHGLLEWWVYFEEIDRIIQTLPFKPIYSKDQDELLNKGVNPGILFSGRTLYEDLNRVGISSFAFINEAYKETAYSKLVFEGCEIVPYKSGSNLMTVLRNKLTDVSTPVYFNVYWSLIDNAAHEYGVHSERYLDELDLIFNLLQEEFLNKLSPQTAENTMIMVTADHGHINVNPEETIYLNHFPEVVNNFRVGQSEEKILPWGSPRDVYIAVDDTKRDYVLSFLTKTLESRAMVISTEDALEQSLFGHGTLHKQFRSRIGDILILPKDNYTVWYEHIEGNKFTLSGMHGGLYPDEMLIPFVITKGIKLL
jgi:hypothetical protein